MLLDVLGHQVVYLAMERILTLKAKAFAKWAKEEDLTDAALMEIVHEMQQGLYGVNLGGGVYKKRVAHGGRGKSGGVRVILAFKLNELAIFVYGFSKNEKYNITHKQKSVLKALAKIYFSYNEEQMTQAKRAGELIEVTS